MYISNSSRCTSFAIAAVTTVGKTSRCTGGLAKIRVVTQQGLR